MAIKAVVSSRARDRIKELLRQITREQGGLYLAMLASSRELPDRWNFIISAPWSDSSGTRSVVSYLSSNLKHYVDKSTLSLIDRIVTFPKTESFVERMLTVRPHSLEQPVRHITNWRAGDVWISEGYIFVVDPDAKTATIGRSIAHREMTAH